MAETTSRKRMSSEQEDNPAKKMPRNIGVASIYLKILIPSNLAGVVLGKGGETIIRIQEENSIKTHMSKGNEYFPGTTDRIATLSGNDPNNIKNGLNAICEKMFEKIDSVREKMTLKMLIPNATAGMIIGKGGEHIRAIKEKSGAFVQLSRKNELPERCITVSGMKDEIAKAADELIDMIAKDPLSGSCVQINYSNFNSEPAGPSPISKASLGRPPMLGDFNNGDDYDPRSRDVNFSLNFASAKMNAGWLSPEAVDYIATSLRACGYRNQAIEEIISAVRILMEYGVLHASSSSRSAVPPSLSSGRISFDDFGNGFAPRLPPRNTISLLGNDRGGPMLKEEMNDSFHLPSSLGQDDQGAYLALQVPDSKVGSIMGAKGSTLLEIQQMSKARVRVSKKDDFVDGTRDRIVYIYGGKMETEKARNLVEWKVKEYDSKYTKR